MTTHNFLHQLLMCDAAWSECVKLGVHKLGCYNLCLLWCQCDWQQYLYFLSCFWRWCTAVLGQYIADKQLWYEHPQSLHTLKCMPWHAKRLILHQHVHIGLSTVVCCTMLRMTVIPCRKCTCLDLVGADHCTKWLFVLLCVCQEPIPAECLQKYFMGSVVRRIVVLSIAARHLHRQLLLWMLLLLCNWCSQQFHQYNQKRFNYLDIGLSQLHSCLQSGQRKCWTCAII